MLYKLSPRYLKPVHDLGLPSNATLDEGFAKLDEHPVSLQTMVSLSSNTCVSALFRKLLS
jgi:hypothetical protein